MMNVIKTAVITIIISVISGLLLEYCKNLSPRILCTIGNGVPIKKNGKKIYAYIITVRNLSNKIVHELTLNIQSLESSLKITDTKITDGLKFDSSIEDNTIDIQIPFLNKDDEFSTKIYVENQYGLYDKPTVVIRSPEKFKEVDSAEQSGIFSLFNKNTNQVAPKATRKTGSVVPDEKDDFTMVMDKPSIAERTINKRNKEALHRNRKTSTNKKAIIIITSIVLFIIAGVFVKSYFKGNSNNAKPPSVETTNPEQSAGTTGSPKGTTKNRVSKPSTSGSTGNSGSKTSTSGTTGGTSGNSDTKTSTGTTSGGSGSKASTGGTTGNSDTKSPTGGTSGNSGSNTSTGGTSGNTGSKTSTGGTTGNSGN